MDLLSLLPSPWRERVGTVFVVGFFAAWIGRRVAAVARRRALAAGRPVPGWAKVLIEIGPGLRAVGEHLPAEARAVYHSLPESDPPPVKVGR